jgi:hypothetical protein
VRNALVYVLANFRKHRQRVLPAGLDPYSSAAWFDGFELTRLRAGSSPLAAPSVVHFAERPPPGWNASPFPVSPPSTWLLRVGWRRRGLLGLSEEPGV